MHLRVFDTHIHADRMSAESLRIPVEDYRCMVPGIHPVETARSVLVPTGDRPGVWSFAAAHHPWYLEGEPDLSEAEALLSHPGIVAVGETGLDHYRHESELERGRAERWFQAHAALAVERGLPLIVHCVQAHADVLRVLRSFPRGQLRGVIHAFSGSPEIAAQYWDLGFYVGIGAAVTRERSKRVRRAATLLPLESILLETDAPFMATGGRQRDEGVAADILDVANAVASLRSQPVEAVAEATYASAVELFAL